MTKPVAIVIMILLTALPAVGTEKSRKASAQSNRAWRANYEALEDERLKELLPEAVDLLEATRTLPEEVDLWGGEDGKVGDGEGTSQETNGESGWVKLLESPAVAPERFARACVKAKRFEHAAELYADLIEKNPNEKHYKIMWFICQRLSNVDVETITRKMSDRGWAQPQQEWVDWAGKVDRLHKSLDGGEKE